MSGQFKPELICSTHEADVTGYTHSMTYNFFEGRRIGPPLSAVTLSCGCEYVDPGYMSPAEPDYHNGDLMALVDRLTGDTIIQWEERNLSDDNPWG